MGSYILVDTTGAGSPFNIYAVKAGGSRKPE
jgi:hypothetical protein